jgi:peptidoglycan/xylan/chitin deacetylase (PgdA/CDA1 family)
MRFEPSIFLRKLMPKLVWNIPGGESGTPTGGAVYLTFDDGPTPAITEWILDELAKWDAKATFFCLGRNVEANPDLYRRMLAEGHRVGNHTWDHAKGWSGNSVAYAADVDRAAGVIDSHLFRPPYGRISPGEAKLVAERYRIVMWNIISRDYNRRISPLKCLNNVVRHIRPGDIVVFHDSRKAFSNMSYALPRTLEYLHSKGMTSKAIEL